MKLLLHDLKQAFWQETKQRLAGEWEAVPALECGRMSCTGCFGCWIRTPGQCVIHDGLEAMGALFGACEELAVVTRICYGGYSPAVKRVIDRSIGHILPFFTIDQDEMHHVPRYEKRPHLTVIGYGEGILEEEERTFRSTASANAVNFRSSGFEAFVVGSEEVAPQLTRLFGAERSVAR